MVRMDESMAKYLHSQQLQLRAHITTQGNAVVLGTASLPLQVVNPRSSVPMLDWLAWYAFLLRGCLMQALDQRRGVQQQQAELFDSRGRVVGSVCYAIHTYHDPNDAVGTRAAPQVRYCVQDHVLSEIFVE